MRLNSRIEIRGRNVILVPYRKSHVYKYHRWMEDEELREQTASERLTLQQEFEMQQTWLNDQNKCTFIVLDTRTWNRSTDEVESMIGDGNLYLKECEETGVLVGEVGVMIAEKHSRGKGLGREATLLLLRYGATEIKIGKFQAIISTANVISINMFKKMKFEVESESEAFKEVTLTRTVDERWLDWLMTETQCYRICPTEPNE